MKSTDACVSTPGPVNKPRARPKRTTHARPVLSMASEMLAIKFWRASAVAIPLAGATGVLALACRQPEHEGGGHSARDPSVTPGVHRAAPSTFDTSRMIPAGYAHDTSAGYLPALQLLVDGTCAASSSSNPGHLPRSTLSTSRMTGFQCSTGYASAAAAPVYASPAAVPVYCPAQSFAALCS